uniref:Nsp1_C domain-containing protein n=1 Tax=Caenorhabditis tropicalis TaxID=1561998 RepID=A0A1I7UST7_9PELO
MISLFEATTPAATNASTVPLFGSTTTASTSGGLFGSKPATTTAPSGGLFGATTTTTASPATGGLFGAKTAAATPPAGGLFGSSTAAPSGGLFGAKPTTTSAPTIIRINSTSASTAQTTSATPFAAPPATTNTVGLGGVQQQASSGSTNTGTVTTSLTGTTEKDAAKDGEWQQVATLIRDVMIGDRLKKILHLGERIQVYDLEMRALQDRVNFLRTRFEKLLKGEPSLTMEELDEYFKRCDTTVSNANYHKVNFLLNRFEKLLKAPAATGGLFGSKPAAAAPPAGGLFGSSTTTAAPSTGLLGGGLFGSTAHLPTQHRPHLHLPSGGLFGATTTTTASPATGGLFGAKTAAATPPAGGLFGSSTTTAAPSTGLRNSQKKCLKKALNI